MSDLRETHILRTIPGLRSLDEALGFRMQLTEQGENAGLVKVRLDQRIAELTKREG